MKIEHTFPKSFPINTINMMRALRAIQEIAPEKLEKATDAFYVSPAPKRKPCTAMTDPGLSTGRILAAQGLGPVRDGSRQAGRVPEDSLRERALL